MKSYLKPSLALGAVLLVSAGCTTSERTLGGAAIGGVGGAVIGDSVGGTGGAVIGGLAGGTAGAVIGNQSGRDAERRRYSRREYY